MADAKEVVSRIKNRKKPAESEGPVLDSPLLREKFAAANPEKPKAKVVEDKIATSKASPMEPATAADGNEAIAKALLDLAPGLLGGLFGGAEAGAIANQYGMENRSRRAAREDDAKKQELAEAKEKRQELMDNKKLAIEYAKLDAEKNKVKEHKPTQYAAAGFARRIQQAEDAFSKLQETGFDPTSKTAALERTGLFPEMAKSEGSKLQDQAERNFINSLLRRESGAAISDSEYSSAEKQYFPRIGDSAEVVAQKAANRAQVFQAIAAEAGSALDQVPAVAVARAPVQQGGGGLPGINEAQAADPMAAQYAKTHGVSMEQANAILAQRRAALGKKQK